MLNSPSSHFSVPRAEGMANADSIELREFGINTFCMALADGVGKSVHSPNAARTATSIATSAALAKNISEIFEEARSALIAGAAMTPGTVWSTTLTVCRVSNFRATVGHVGDSRLYHLRGEGIITRTRDQTELQALIDEGVISRERAKKYPRRNVLLSALSSDSNYELQLSEFEVARGDRLLLISDGIYKQIFRREIAEISVNTKSVDHFIQDLKALLIARGIIDDSSAICVQIE